MHTTTDQKEGEQLEDRRNVGENSCNSGDGTDQTGPILYVCDDGAINTLSLLSEPKVLLCQYESQPPYRLHNQFNLIHIKTDSISLHKICPPKVASLYSQDPGYNYPAEAGYCDR